MGNDLPRIVAIAIRIPLVEHRGVKRPETVISAPAPARHHDVLKIITAIGLSAARIGWPDNQGFLLSDGTFLGRVGAYQLARDNGQLRPRPDARPAELYSEDLW